MDLLVDLRSPRKRIINIKNKDQKCFLILQKKIQKELKNWQKKKLLKNVIMMELVSPARKRFQQDWGEKQYMH